MAKKKKFDPYNQLSGFDSGAYGSIDHPDYGKNSRAGKASDYVKRGDYLTAPATLEIDLENDNPYDLNASKKKNTVFRSIDDLISEGNAKRQSYIPNPIINFQNPVSGDNLTTSFNSPENMSLLDRIKAVFEKGAAKDKQLHQNLAQGSNMPTETYKMSISENPSDVINPEFKASHPVISKGIEEFTSLARNTIGKPLEVNWIDRAVSQAANAMTMSDAAQLQDTGSRIGNFTTDIIGSGIGFTRNIPGANFSVIKPAQEALSPVNNLIDRGVAKLSQPAFKNAPNVATYKAADIASRYGGQALKSGLEFGALNGIGTTANMDLQDITNNKEAVIQSIIEGMKQGALWGAGGKALHEAVFPNAIKTNTYESKMGIKNADRNYKTQEEIKGENQRQQLEDYYNNLDWQDYSNSLNKDYIRAENEYRKKLGLSPIGYDKPYQTDLQRNPNLQGDSFKFREEQRQRQQFTPDGPEGLHEPLKRVVFNSTDRNISKMTKHVPIDDLISETKDRLKLLEEEEYQHLKSYEPQGVEQGGVIKDNEGYIQGRFGRYSNNSEWYQKAYKTYGRKPNNSELRDIAREHLKNGFVDMGVEVPPHSEYNDLLTQLKQYENYKLKLEGKRTGVEVFTPKGNIKSDIVNNEPVSLSEPVKNTTPTNNVTKVKNEPKKPYEMTSYEYLIKRFPNYEKVTRSEGMGSKNAPTMAGTAGAEHRRIIIKALKDGKEVPEEVLKDYPDLIKADNINSSTDNIISKNTINDTGKVNDVPNQFKGNDTSKNLGIVANGTVISPPSKRYTYEDANLEAIDKKNYGIGKPSFIQRVKSGLEEFKNMATRTFRDIPDVSEINGGKVNNAELIKNLVAYDNNRTLAGTETKRILKNITDGLDENTFNTFRRKIQLDDLLEDANNGLELPNGWTKDKVEYELKRIKSYITPDVQKALDKRNKYIEGTKNEYVKAMDDIGFDVSDRFKKKNYFRHQVLDYMAVKKIAEQGGKVKTPKGRGFLKSREGTSKDINTDYLQAEYEVLAQMKHDIGVARIAKNILDNYDISDRLKKQANGKEDWHNLIPEGYKTFQMENGNRMFRATTMPQSVVNEILAYAPENIGINIKDLRKVLAVGTKYKEYILPDYAVNHLENMTAMKDNHIVARASKRLLGTWKSWVLTKNPVGVVKYNTRNFTGDLDKVIAGDPGILKYYPQSVRELRNARKYGVFTKDLLEFRDRGGYENLTIPQEISDISNDKMFKKFSGKKNILNPIGKYSELTSTLTNEREAQLRYAGYLYYKNVLTKGLVKYGASKPEVIKGLKTIEDKAYKLQKDLLGAYDEVSELGKVLRDHLIPFYSWLEVNFKSYTQLMKNAINQDIVKEQLQAKSKETNIFNHVMQTGKNLAKGTSRGLAFSLLCLVWNQFAQKDNDDALPPSVRNTAHLTLGRDAQGNILYFNRIGALSDFLDWFGMDSALSDYQDIKDGRKSIKDQVVDMVKSPASKVLTGITPALKVPIELLTKKQFFPDPLNPSNIRDMGQNLANDFGIKDIYDRVVGNPHSDINDLISKVFIYKANSDASAYQNVIDIKSKFLKMKGEDNSNTSYASTPKSVAMYKFKQALKLGDEDAAKKFIAEYVKNGGTGRGMKMAIQYMSPLYGLKDEAKNEFINSLKPKEKEQLDKAVKYYKEVLNAGDSDRLSELVDALAKYQGWRDQVQKSSFPPERKKEIYKEIDANMKNIIDMTIKITK